jgi:hypothetical protein
MGLGQIVGSDGKPEGPVRRIGESNPTNGVIAVHINQFRSTDILAVPWENYGAVSTLKVNSLCRLLIKSLPGIDLFHRKLEYPHCAHHDISEVMYRATRSSTEVFDCKFCRPLL